LKITVPIFRRGPAVLQKQIIYFWRKNQHMKKTLILVRHATAEDQSFRIRDFDRNLNKEHSEIADAVLARDADLAVQRMKKHIELTAVIIGEAAEKPLSPVK